MPQRQQWRPDHGNGMGAHGATAMPHHHSVSGDPSMIHSCMHAYECVARRSAGAQREIEIGRSIPPGGLSLVASRMRTNGGAYAWPPPGAGFAAYQIDCVFVNTFSNNRELGIHRSAGINVHSRRRHAGGFLVPDVSLGHASSETFTLQISLAIAAAGAGSPFSRSHPAAGT
jgi:hypothetical protein